MNRKISLGLAISLIAIASAITFIFTSFFSLQSFNEKVVDVNEKSQKYSALQTLDSYVRENYYGDIDEDALTDGILKGYVDGLDDDYSRYLTAEEYRIESSEDAGELVGIGLTLTEDESGYIRVVEIMSGSPAANSDLVPGDIITCVDGNDVLVEGFEESIDAMSGQVGTEITITVRRDGIDTDMVFTRTSMELTTITGEMINGNIGYIQITGFKKNTSEQFISVLEELNLAGTEAFIFDLRDNGGGLVSVLEECVDPLLPEGVIATAEYKDGHSETLVYSDASELDVPMVVLVNENTASAAELFSASLRDFDKAVLVGVQTYGKGVMQVTTELEDGGAIVLTVAEYKTTESECYDGVGLTPDYIVEDDEDDESDPQYDKALEVAQQLISES
ncbi:MAG: S41 family peptidase [Ruminococcus sp.]|nr:S41 family peptidase [Ruminococcus sp.]